MAEVEFNGIKFDDETYGAYIESLPHMRTNALLKSGAIMRNDRIKGYLMGGTGTFSTRIPMMGRIGGKPVNYDGQNDIPYDGIGSLSQRICSYGRAKAWGRNQFVVDITGGVEPIDWMGRQVADYWDDVNMDTLTCITNGIFSMTDTASAEFVEKHTLDLTVGDDAVDRELGADSLNTAVQKASGDKRGIFTSVVMHSTVAKNLENQQLITYMKGTDSNGMERDLTMATWNGRTVIIDDGVPFDSATGKYTTYLFGNGAFYADELGAMNAVEVYRKPLEKGGIDLFINRRRRFVIPHGISFVGNPATDSPTDEEFAVGTNWEIVQDKKTGEKYSHQFIPFARIISLG